MNRVIVYKGSLNQLVAEHPSGNGQSAALVQLLAEVGHPSRWKPGDRVVDLDYLPPGTVIANFEVTKRLPGRSGFAAAIFKRFGPRLTRTKQAGSFVIMDSIGMKPRSRTLYNHGPNSPYGHPDNAYDYVVVKV